MVTETASYKKDEKWISIFGDLLMIQEPDKNDHPVGMAMDFDRSYGYLMLFKDGNRVDLHIETKEAMENFLPDKHTVALLDKDNILPVFLEPTDTGSKSQQKHSTSAVVMTFGGACRMLERDSGEMNCLMQNKCLSMLLG